jgi:hypothetical protein
MLRPQQRFLSGAIRLVFLGLDMGPYGLDQLVVDGGVLQVRSGSGPRHVVPEHDPNQNLAAWLPTL